MGIEKGWMGRPKDPSELTACVQIGFRKGKGEYIPSHIFHDGIFKRKSPTKHICTRQVDW